MSVFGSAIVGKLVGVAAKVGAPIVKGVLEKHLGDKGTLGVVGGLAGSLAERMVNVIAVKAGVEPEQLGEVDEKVLVKAVETTEAVAPELIALWSRGLELQQALSEKEEERGFLYSFWRVGWMYLLAGFWIWRIVLVPMLGGFGLALEAVDFGVLLTLTSWFMALYMGGHTVKELGKNVAGVLSGGILKKRA